MGTVLNMPEPVGIKQPSTTLWKISFWVNSKEGNRIPVYTHAVGADAAAATEKFLANPISLTRIETAGVSVSFVGYLFQ